jgi:hypothetical protein
VWVGYRYRNEFGAMAYRDSIFEVEDDGPLRPADEFLPYRQVGSWSDTPP